MLTLRAANDRGHAQHGWLDSWHSFSFADYQDPRHMQFGPLRVINEDRVAAGRGFGKHGHQNMEIISYVLEGALGHEDSLGNRSTIVPGDVQRMSAGTGVQHAEFNHRPDGQTHFLQIWILPTRNGGAPGYEQKAFPESVKRGRLALIVSPEGSDGSVRVQQDARIHAGLFDGEERASLPLGPGRRGYAHLARGRATVNGRDLNAGDALLLQDEPQVNIEKGSGAEILLFDLPPE